MLVNGLARHDENVNLTLSNLFFQTLGFKNWTSNRLIPSIDDDAIVEIENTVCLPILIIGVTHIIFLRKFRDFLLIS